VSDQEDKRPRSIHLDDLERIPGPASLTWLPLRATLGIRAFGTNAYVAGKVGDDVVEPHTEDDGLAHQELYFVARGHARFTIDGETIDAPSGTYVFIPDPKSHRHAVAEEEGTTVLSFGGPPNFTPSAWEWHFRATPIRESDPERAREILEDGLRTHPESPSLHYYLGCLEATLGNRDAAIEQLGIAIGKVPDLAREARDEEALESLHDDADFRRLTGG
jgi:hypothetical protein